MVDYLFKRGVVREVRGALVSARTASICIFFFHCFNREVISLISHFSACIGSRERDAYSASC